MSDSTREPTIAAEDRVRRELSLDRWLVAMLVVHVVAVLEMPLVLARFLPGGGLDDEARVHLIATSPWLYRLGWLGWQITALVDIGCMVAIARASWLARPWRFLAFVATVMAVIPDQLATLLFVTTAPEHAARDSLTEFLAWEGKLFPLTAGLATALYTVGAFCSFEAFRRVKIWSRSLGRAAGTFYVFMGAAAIVPLVPVAVPPRVVSALNAVGFLLLLVVYALLIEAVGRWRIREVSTGRWAPWRHPSSSFVARAIDRIAESRLAYALLEPLPVVSMESEISDVVYVNYLVDASRLEPHVPPGLELDRIGEGKAILTFLTFRHHRFGFRFLGPLRRLSPSSIQTNWRVHVRDPRSKREGILFVTNAITSTAQALGARLFSEGMPMHVLERAELTRDGEGAIHLTLDPGSGSAPDCELVLRRAPRTDLPEPFEHAFGTFERFVAYIVPQNRALSSQPYKLRITSQEIHLPIPLVTCELLEGTVHSNAARRLVGDAPVVAFRVPRVAFLFKGETHTTS